MQFYYYFFLQSLSKMANGIGYEKNVRRESVSTPFDLKSSESGGKIINKINYIFLLRNLWEKKFMNNLPGIFFSFSFFFIFVVGVSY